MESRNSKKRTRGYAIRVFMILVAFFAIADFGLIYAGEVTSQKDEQQSACSFRIGKQFINFSAYQPHVNHKSLCSKFPEATGVTYFSLDLLHEKLQNNSFKVKLTPIKQGEGELQSTNPVKIFDITSTPAGVITFEYDFKGAKGLYRLDVVNELDKSQGSFEFEVGATAFEWDSKFGQKVAFGMFALFALLGVGYTALKKKKA